MTVTITIPSITDILAVPTEPVAVTLPAATGGQTPYTYTLTPALPTGITFDAATRALSGAATAVAAQTEYTYTATDADGETGAQTFNIRIAAGIYNAPVVDPQVAVGLQADPFVGVVGDFDDSRAALKTARARKATSAKALLDAQAEDEAADSAVSDAVTAALGAASTLESALATFKSQLGG